MWPLEELKTFGYLNFYSHIPCGMWRDWQCNYGLRRHFYSHIPCGMWLVFAPYALYYNKFLLTHPVWDVTPSVKVTLFVLTISTHTSRVGCDIPATATLLIACYFYSHIPCGMWQCGFCSVNYSFKNFYSHIPCGMWHRNQNKRMYHRNFYSHIPCGMWLGLRQRMGSRQRISTHTSRVGCDYMAVATENKPKFLLTHPVWDVTILAMNSVLQSKNFYSHIPCGMWQHYPSNLRNLLLFLLTHPVWDVT